MITIGDAIGTMLRIPRDTYGATITSPPYNIGVDYGVVDDKMSVAEYSEFTQDWIYEALRISEVLVVNFGNPTSKPINLARFMVDCEEVGHIQSHIVWVKSVSTNDFSRGHFKPVNSDRYITNLHESILVVSRDGNYKLDRLSVGVPFADKSNIARFKSNKGDLRCRGNVWLVPYETKNIRHNHPATYPLELAQMMVKLVRPRSVIDPFVGSGTTIRACESLGIPCDGIDLKEWT